MSNDGQFDVIIIGSGAGGGTLARHLAPTGKRILILEHGDWLPREAENWDSKEVFVENRYVPKRPGTTTRTSHSNRVSITRSVARPSSTAPRSTASGRRISASCATTTAFRPPGPSRYDDMEPYYTKAEQLYEVHGNRGEDPTEGHASAPYPFPAVSHEPRIQQLSDDLDRAGYHPFHAPCGVRLLHNDMPRSLCIRCRTCDGFPCLVQAKSDAEMMASDRRSSIRT